MPDKLLTLSEVADYLGISKKQAESLVVKGKLTAYKIGGSFVRFRPEQVEAVKNEIAHAPKPPAATPAPTDTHRARATSSEKLFDFFYFNDFYIAALLVMLTLLIIIIFF
jgi:excisionase family DNA binding protein